MAEKKNPVEDAGSEVFVDMTSARLLQALDPRRPYLCAVSDWSAGKSASGGRKLHYGLAVVEPSDVEGQKLIEDLSLDNEFTLGRLLQLLLALGFSEEEVRTKDFRLPTAEDVLGRQLTVWVQTRSSEQFGDRSRVKRLSPASVYPEVAAT